MSPLLVIWEGATLVGWLVTGGGATWVCRSVGHPRLLHIHYVAYQWHITLYISLMSPSPVTFQWYCTFPLCRPPLLHIPYVACQWHITLYISIMSSSGIFQNNSNFIMSYHTQFSSKSQVYWHIHVLGHVTGAEYHIHFIIPSNLHHQTDAYGLLLREECFKTRATSTWHIILNSQANHKSMDIFVFFDTWPELNITLV